MGLLILSFRAGNNPACASGLVAGVARILPRNLIALNWDRDCKPE